MNKIIYVLISILSIGFTSCTDSDNDKKVIIDGKNAQIHILAGQMRQVLGNYDMKGVESVIIKGYMNLYDFKALGEMTDISKLDISGVKLSGGVFEENSSIFESSGEVNYFLWEWAFRYLGSNLQLRYPNLKIIVLPDYNYEISTKVLAYYEKLETVVLPPYVIKIGSKSFFDCPLKTVRIKNSEPPILGIDVFNSLSSNCILYVPKGAKTKYEKAEGWKNFKTIMEE